MIAKDVRILDQDGKISNRGRVEVRSDGLWGTICASGLDAKAANTICKQVGYKEGRFLNPKDSQGRGYCSNFEGLNYCGVPASQIFYSHLSCQGNEVSILDCYKQIADRGFCTHDYDTLIECSNSDAEEYVSFDSGSIRLINYSGNPSIDGIGRLEILRGSWGTVCSTRFTDISAKVACVQMGFLDGKLYGHSDSTNTCTNVNGLNYCGDFSQSIRMTEVKCEGSEKYFKDCKASITTSSCSHNQDVIIKCEGLGDPSGKSQNVRKAKILNPIIEKLPTLPTFNAKCDSVARVMNFRGDPGSIFLVNCPSDCLNSTSTVIGTGVYSLDSSICRAAIHSGVISNEGGNIVLTKTFGQNKYFPSSLRDVNSLESSYLKSSFFISAVNSAVTNMVSMINNGSFLELGVDEQSCDMKKFYSKYLYSSFLENGIDIKALYEWTSTNEMIFDGVSKYVDLYPLEPSRIILEKKTFTLYTKIRLSAITDNPQTIISVGGCEGFSIFIDNSSELIFDVKCGSNTYKSGIYIPLNYNVHLSIVFEGSKLVFYLDGVKYNEINCYFTLRYKPKLTIGKNSEYDKDYFNGTIFLIAFFGEPFGPNRNLKIFSEGYIKPDQVKKSKFVTLDNRNCISTCALLPFPGLPGSPNPPTEAITYEVNGDKTILAGGISQTTTEMSPFKEVKCQTSAAEVFYGDVKVGDMARLKCPLDCKDSKGSVYGTIVYTIDSSICLSAIHAGLKDIKMVLIKILPGLSSYPGTLQYGIQSTSIDGAKYSFTLEEAPQITTIDCKTTAADNQFNGSIGMKYLVNCPQNCSKLQHLVYGNEEYSADSSICQAGIHSGALNDKGGEIQFQIEPGKKIYFGKKAFGIDSKERESYVKSIKFFNTNNRLYIKYQEEFKEQSLSTNWDIYDNFEATDYPSRWEIKETPDKTSKAIYQSKRIRTENNNLFGSIITLRNADVVNLSYKMSIYFNSLSPVGIVFRHKDNNNYYSLRINNLGQNKVILNKLYEGKLTTLATAANISISPRVWYTFTITATFDKFQAFIQIGDLRNNLLLFEATDNDIQRGSLGLATNGNDDFYVKGLSVDDFDISKIHINDKHKSNTRSFEMILQENTQNHRNKYCKTLHNDVNDINMCKEFHNYCRTRCNAYIHKRENILNFSCQKECIKDSIMKEKIANIQMTESLGFGINNQVWSPKEKEKCDYKPDDFGAYWVPCYIMEVRNDVNDPEAKYLQIKFKVADTEKMITMKYPNITIKQCGVALTGRDDCGNKAIELPHPF
jgi:hypothetical protein